MSTSPVAFEIPLQATPQTLSVSLNGNTYNLTVHWCDGPTIQSPCWILDIADVNDNPLAQGIPMVTGADLLEQFGYLGIGGQLFVQTDNDPDAVPTFTNLGTIGHLYFVPDASS